MISHHQQWYQKSVLIESDWNLKYAWLPCLLIFDSVLIESDWNLKYFLPVVSAEAASVLIESDWNLKELMEVQQTLYNRGINRIRLEFKAV